jgi:hypothetical protein
MRILGLVHSHPVDKHICGEDQIVPVDVTKVGRDTQVDDLPVHELGAEADNKVERTKYIGSTGTGRAPVSSTRGSGPIPPARMVHDGWPSFTQVMYPSYPGLYSNP